MWPIKTRGIFLASESSLSRGAMAPFSRAGITEFPVRVFLFVLPNVGCYRRGRRCDRFAPNSQNLSPITLSGMAGLPRERVLAGRAWWGFAL